jgi:molybdopterin converting factor small subunit
VVDDRRRPAAGDLGENGDRLMAVSFVIPGALRELAGNRSDVRVDGAAGSLGDALSRLWAECPAVRDRVLTERGDVRPHINIFIDGENSRYAGGLAAPVRDGAEIMLIPAVSGGAPILRMDLDEARATR